MPARHAVLWNPLQSSSVTSEALVKAQKITDQNRSVNFPWYLIATKSLGVNTTEL
jgi:hypothetical protein